MESNMTWRKQAVRKLGWRWNQIWTSMIIIKYGIYWNPLESNGIYWNLLESMHFVMFGGCGKQPFADFLELGPRRGLHCWAAWSAVGGTCPCALTGKVRWMLRDTQRLGNILDCLVVTEELNYLSANLTYFFMAPITSRNFNLFLRDRRCQHCPVPSSHWTCWILGMWLHALPSSTVILAL